MENQALIWTTEEEKKALHTRIFDVEEHRCRSPGGKVGSYYRLHSPDFAIVIPVLDGEHFVMVRQWRHGVKCLSTEFPGGVVEPGEDPEAGAARELREETGYTPGRMVRLGSFSANPAIMSNTCHVFAAYDLTQSGERHLDPDEYVEVVVKSQAEVIRNFGTAPEYHHALMASALMLFCREAS